MGETVLTEEEAEQLRAAIHGALTGDLSGLEQAGKLLHEVITDRLPAWRWSNEGCVHGWLA